MDELSRAEIEAMPAEEVGRRLLQELKQLWQGGAGILVTEFTDAMLRHIAPAMLERGWEFHAFHGGVQWVGYERGWCEQRTCDGYDWPAAACRAALLALSAGEGE